ncbi:MAG TPA: glutamate 5-kinase [Caulobacteraceae bacterium]|jgi:glutamate 5-kinase
MSTSTPSAASVLRDARRLVLKCGSSLVVENGAPAASRLASIARDIVRLRAAGRQVLVVSSGAVALGRPRLGLTRRRRLDETQAAAAVGQAALIEAWQAAFAPHGVVVAQVLLTRGDTESRRGWLNARATIDALLKLGAVPVVNENDTIATEEIRYGDNDRLAARTAQMVRADTLLLLSDIDGLYDADPRRNPGARHLERVADLTPEILAAAGGANAAANVGTGGMITKLKAAEIARAAGCATIIARGDVAEPVKAIESGARATLIEARAAPKAAYKQWIAGHLAPQGVLVADAGAADAIRAGKSLLPSGVSAVEGGFRRGDCVEVRDAAGRKIALGLSNYDARDAAPLCGRRSAEIAGLVGYQGPPELIHRDDLVLQEGGGA